MISQIVNGGKSPGDPFGKAYQATPGAYDTRTADAVRLVVTMIDDLPVLRADVDTLPATHRPYLLAVLAAHKHLQALTTHQSIHLDTLQQSAEDYCHAFDEAYALCFALLRWRFEYAANLAEQLAPVDGQRAANLHSRVARIAAELPQRDPPRFRLLLDLLQRLEQALIPAEVALADQPQAESRMGGQQ